MVERTQKDISFDLEEDLEMVKQALFEGLKELEKFLLEREEGQNGGRFKDFEGQGENS
ncbi:MAG: hypothetical protein SWQ30_10045 [Thermodesulfobacteriota bacterium]|nr:hypothetical protein [Thermodesulfobacteriota bacterium]